MGGTAPGPAWLAAAAAAAALLEAAGAWASSLLMARLGRVRRNYRGRAVPTSAGISFLLPAGLAALLLPAGAVRRAWLAALVMAAVGLYDDTRSPGEARGLRGHLHELLRGRLSGGVLKAAAGLATAGWAAWGADGGWPLWLVRTLVMALSANVVNVFDLRTGRAGKWLLGALLLLELAGLQPAAAAAGWMGAAAVAAWLFFDLGERAMLGDAGANATGIWTGALFALGAPPGALLLALALLAGVQVAAEVTSLSFWIEHWRFLRFLDQLGRRT
jgi:UDP-GlcNAc:undecaprenyl-phosphate GlcNAc-1-phosphate transferase